MDYLAYKNDCMFDGFWSTEFHEIKDIPKDKIQISGGLKTKILSNIKSLRFKDISKLDSSKIYDVDDFVNLFEEYDISIPTSVSRQDKFNADLLKQNAQLLTEISAQKQLNSQILLELAKLKQGGNANV